MTPLASTLVTVCSALALSVYALHRVAFMGAAAGVYLFVRGFLLLARQRLLVHTPTSTICNAFSGLLEISGSVTGPYTLQAPITGEDCFLYRTIAWQPIQSRRGVRWEKLAEENQYVPFFLNDTTGQLLVDAGSAEFDLVQDFREDFDLSAFSENDLLPPEVSTFLARNGVIPHGRIRIEEWTVIPNQALFVVGTVTENSGAALKVSAAAQAGSPDRPALPDQLTPSATETIRLSPTSTPAAAAEMTLQGKIAAALVKAGAQNGDLWETQVHNGVPATPAAPQLPQLVVNGARQNKFENGSAPPQLVLRKGSDNPMFLISWRSRLDVIRSLNWKSFARIWGGAGLILGSVYVLFT